MGANSLLTVMTYGMLAWYIEFLIRTYGVPRETAGLQFGLINIIAGSLGALTVGWLVQPMVQRGVTDAPARSSETGRVSANGAKPRAIASS